MLLRLFFGWLLSQRIWKRVCALVGLFYCAGSFTAYLDHNQIFGGFNAVVASYWFYNVLWIHERMKDSR